ncbi:MAG: hypothetical protein QHC65_17340 [Sphingomonas sp.]|nr:hypothetical protein [Sphingomonas sp.]MDX3886189.1 hypothetical protein [Sphingomonas sp.]
MSAAPSGRQLLIYFSWSRPAEISAPLDAIEDRFPAIFELRRLFYPRFEPLADPARFDQGIAGFLDHVQKPNFAAFADLAGAWSGRPAIMIERTADDGTTTRLDDALLAGVDTIVVISFDSLRTGQTAATSEVAAVRRFLAAPDHLIFLCPHHDIGEAMAGDEGREERRIAEHLHHGDAAIPPRQGFGGFARSLLAGLGVPVDNRFGLRPAIAADGSPAPVDVAPGLDVLGLLDGVATFNLHPHLPHLERIGASIARMEVLATQRIDPSAPPHPFTQGGRTGFDALLQSRPETFAGTLLVSDATLFSSTAGGADSLRRLWSNLMARPRRC